MSDPSNYVREYSPDGSYSLFQFERSDVISVLKNSIEYSFAFFKCLSKIQVLSFGVKCEHYKNWKFLLCNSPGLGYFREYPPPPPPPPPMDDT